jgi:hypothetical protein
MRGGIAISHFCYYFYSMTKTIPSILHLIAILLFGISASGQASSKSIVLKQIAELKQAVINSDQAKVSTFFDFPIVSEELKARVEYAGENVVTIDRLDKSAFNKHYSRIMTDDIVNLFKAVDFSALKTKNKVERKMIPDNKIETCYYTYTIEYSNSGITLSLLTNTRDDIELDEGAVCPEYFEKWNFKLNKGKLKFTQFEAAG